MKIIDKNDFFNNLNKNKETVPSENKLLSIRLSKIYPSYKKDE